MTAPMTSREELLNLADALEKADWAGVSIGNKMMLVGAIEALRAAPAQEKLTPKAWQRRHIKDGVVWSSWYIADDEPTPENMKFDGVFSYEYRPLYALPSTQSGDGK